jgi:hypothetical protein
MKVELWLTFDAVNEPNHVCIGMNGHECWSGRLTESIVAFDAELRNGSNQLTIEVDNRDEVTSTLLDAQGNIVKNTYVAIENIVIDDYMMRELKNDYGSLKVDWTKNKNAYEFLSRTGDPNEHLKKTSYIALNGTYCFDFEAPIDQWLMKVRTVDGYVFEQLMREDQRLLDEVIEIVDEGASDRSS